MLQVVLEPRAPPSTHGVIVVRVVALVPVGRGLELTIVSLESKPLGNGPNVDAALLLMRVRVRVRLGVRAVGL